MELDRRLCTANLIRFLRLLRGLEDIGLRLLRASAERQRNGLRVLATLLCRLLSDVRYERVETLYSIISTALVLVVVVMVVVDASIRRTMTFRVNGLVCLRVWAGYFRALGFGF